MKSKQFNPSYELFQKLCKAHNVLPEELFERYGISLGKLLLWEQGRITLTAPEAHSIANHFEEMRIPVANPFCIEGDRQLRLLKAFEYLTDEEKESLVKELCEIVCPK